jgi:hypothetical protein
LPQLYLEFTRVDAVSLRHGFNGGIRQDLLQARFATVRAQVARGPRSPRNDGPRRLAGVSPCLRRAPHRA